jgi:hypothetical protein
MEELDIDTNMAEAILFIANFFHKRNDAGRAEEFYSLLLGYVGKKSICYNSKATSKFLIDIIIS